MFGPNLSLEAIRGRPATVIYQTTTSGHNNQIIREVQWDQVYSDWYRLQYAIDLQIAYNSSAATTDVNTYTSTDLNLSFTETIGYTDNTKAKRSSYARVQN